MFNSDCRMQFALLLEGIIKDLAGMWQMAAYFSAYFIVDTILTIEPYCHEAVRK